MHNKNANNQKQITLFRDEYFFLSNFYPCRIHYYGLSFMNAESAFQAMKRPEMALQFILLTPSEAKKLGRTVPIRKDWEQVKEKIMYEICLAKFTQNPELKQLLLETGDSILIEGNTWNDTEWGVCRGNGENKLGKILMRVREELKVKAQAEENKPDKKIEAKFFSRYCGYDYFKDGNGNVYVKLGDEIGFCSNLKQGRLTPDKAEPCYAVIDVVLIY